MQTKTSSNLVTINIDCSHNNIMETLKVIAERHFDDQTPLENGKKCNQLNIGMHEVCYYDYKMRTESQKRMQRMQ